VVILTELVVFNFCTFHLKEKWTTMLPVERLLAVRPWHPTESTAMKKMEMQKIISYATVMKIEKKNIWNIFFVSYCLLVAKMEK
jgi:hypothetical protein